MRKQFGYKFYSMICIIVKLNSRPPNTSDATISDLIRVFEAYQKTTTDLITSFKHNIGQNQSELKNALTRIHNELRTFKKPTGRSRANQNQPQSNSFELDQESTNTLNQPSTNSTTTRCKSKKNSQNQNRKNQKEESTAELEDFFGINQDSQSQSNENISNNTKSRNMDSANKRGSRNIGSKSTRGN